MRPYEIIKCCGLDAGGAVDIVSEIDTEIPFAGVLLKKDKDLRTLARARR